MANQNNQKKQKTPKSKIAVRVVVIILALLMVVSSVGLIISGCQNFAEEYAESHEGHDH